MQRFLGTLIAKLLQLILSLGHSKGQALPGLIVEQFFPSYLEKMINQLPDGVVLITGTNGKTTTTKMVVDLLQAGGKRVVTNRTGSNLTRGLVAGIAQQASLFGRLKQDLAVFEIDEAFAVQFVGRIQPDWVLSLNVSRDQLDRFGEVDSVAKLLGTVMQAASKGVVTNADDPRLTAVVQGIKAPVYYFGVAPGLRKYFPTDNELVAVKTMGSETPAPSKASHTDVELLEFKDTTASYRVGKDKLSTSLQVTGQHNFQNAAAALLLVHHLLPERSIAKLGEDLSKVEIAFGRGEVYQLPTGNVQLVLVKNPPSFRQALASYPTVASQTMIAINDNYADSRDVSWLWDVDFDAFANKQICVTSGSRAADMALRLDYDQATVDHIEPDLSQAVSYLTKDPGDKTVFATYTAMLWLHDHLTNLQTGATNA